MSSTHRGLNRFLLILLGLALLGSGALTAAAGILPNLARIWTETGTQALDLAREQLPVAAIPGAGVSWWTIAAIGSIILAVILLVGWISSQGGGRTGHAGSRDDGGHGTTTVDAGLLDQAVKAATAGNDGILTASVTSWTVKGDPALKLSIQVRKGASPAAITATSRELVAGIDGLLGEPLPVLIRIGAGNRTRFAKTQRVR
jgi:hypothetical protein